MQGHHSTTDSGDAAALGALLLVRCGYCQLSDRDTDDPWWARACLPPCCAESEDSEEEAEKKKKGEEERRKKKLGESQAS